MAWDKGINFRNTPLYVDDQTATTNNTYMPGIDSGAYLYPQVRNGVTFGWEGGMYAVDRNAGVDPRFAGLNYVLNTGTPVDFRVDLPNVGQYLIRLALGDHDNNQDNQYVVILDTTSVLVSLGPLNTPSGAQYLDATGVVRAEADWPSLNAPAILTFSTTILRLRIGTPTNTTGVTAITHLFISQASAGPIFPPYRKV